MTQKEIIRSFVQLGQFLDDALSHQSSRPNATRLVEAIQKEYIYNGWFTPDSVTDAIHGIRSWLYEDALTQWAGNYTYQQEPKSVGVIMAGNIPLVGFHDLLSVLVSGNHAMIKLSSDDRRLLPILLGEMVAINPELQSRISLVLQLKNFDAVIATGSDNSAAYFEQYFAHVPRLIRRNRTSVAVISGNEAQDDLTALGKDIFSFFGLGCRNVSKMLVPVNFDLNRFFGAMISYSELINHHKYANNYDYYRTIYLMNLEPILENGFLLLKETEELHSPLSVLYYQRYSSDDEVNDFLRRHDDKIQAVIGHDFIPFGQGQNPSLCDYADGVDTMSFLSNI
jgi:hypothetical protein